jgi:hypothetical protein
MIFTVITPAGNEVVLGVFRTDASARRACFHFLNRFPARINNLADGPFRRRALRDGEQVNSGDRWEG